VRRLRPLVILVALLACAPLQADLIRVPGDYDTIPEAVHYATADDTVIVGTGVYTVEPGSPFGWPIDLDADSPTIRSADGVGKTVLEGDGTTPAFHVPGPPGPLARVHIIGFTIRSVSTPLLKEAECGANFHFTYNNIQDSGDGLDATWSDGLIAYNIIWNNGGNGIEIYHYFGVVEFNEIAYNAWGIRGTCCEEPVIRQNWIHRNSLGGIRTGFHASIENNVIHKNGGPGISLSASYGQVTGNTITENVVGIEIWSVPEVVLRENRIHDNTPYDVATWLSIQGDYDATMNWWGTTDPALIAEHIWDCHDEPEVGLCVVFDPFCWNPNCEPTLVEPLSWGAIKAIYR
jgi:parallel beta-helix repeat protein